MREPIYAVYEEKVIACMLDIRFLGVPVVSFANVPLTELNQSPTLMRLFAFLVTHHHQPQDRSRLAGTFWPDCAEQRARRTLNNVVWRLRGALGAAAAVLQIDKQTIQFNPQAVYWLDTKEFEGSTRALDALSATLPPSTGLTAEQIARFEATLALYRGDFLEGIDDDWALYPRETWRERYCNALESFAAACQVHGEWERALAAARQVTMLEPYRESGHERLIELYGQLNRRQEAQAQFDLYAQIWLTELRLAPSAHMLKLAEQYGIRPSSPVSSIPATVLGDAHATLAQAHPAYLRLQLEICYKNDDLYDLMAARQQQIENLSSAQALVDALNDPVAQIIVLGRRAWLATRQGDYTEALQLAQAGLACCDKSRAELQRAWLHRLIGVASEEMGNFSAALHHYTKALHLDEAYQDLAWLPADLNNVAAAHLALANYVFAIQHLERAHCLLIANPVPRVQGMVLGNLGYAWLKLGQIEKADCYLQQALTLVQRIGDRGTEWWLAALVARLYHLRGETDRALTFALHYYHVAEPTGDSWVLTYLADTLAKLYADEGDGRQSLQWAQCADQHARQKQQWRYQVRGQLRLAQAQSLLHQHATAFCTIAQAVAQYSAQKQTLEEEPELFTTYARCAVSMGKTQRALQAEQTAQAALQHQCAAIPDLALQVSFLRVQA